MEAGRGPKRESVLVQRSCENEKYELKILKEKIQNSAVISKKWMLKKTDEAISR